MKYLVSVMLLYCVLPGYAQEEKSFVYSTFRSVQLINSQTTEMIQPKGFDFNIRHRFGMVGVDSTLYQQFFGLDLPANIRFGFAFPITDRLYIGCGRTKSGKMVDAEIKYLILHQTENNKMPVSVATYASSAIMTDKFPKVPAYAYFDDTITPFRYRFNHRLSYNLQMIVSRKFSERISFQISADFIYKNLVSPGYENHTFAIPVGGVVKTGLNSSFIFEYAYRFNNRPVNKDYPLSIAWESGTVGHIFQIVLSSSTEFTDQELHTRNAINYLKGNFALGFNIRRTFWFKKKRTI